MSPLAGEQFRHFRLVEKVGEGGMGEVYRAEDDRLGRSVALKFLNRAQSADSGFAARLRREARSLAALSHANIVTIFDIDEADGVPFLVLEWIGGATLDRSLAERPCSEETFLRIGIPVAEALAAAHAHDMVHRDLKPGNVLIASDGSVKLVDFGLAKLRGADPGLTRTSTIVGTAAYMSPEQIAGGDVGPPSDVFSFGVLAYELLTGATPFRGDGLPAVLYAIAHQPHVPLRTARPEISEAVAAVVERCLAKDPAARYRDGEELARDLRRAAHGDPATRPMDRSAAGLTHRPAAASLPRPGAGSPEVRFCTTTDGARIAYSVHGTGPLLVRVLGWFTHLEMEWEWPALRQIWEQLGESFTVVRYDGRGIGLSDPWAAAFTEDSRQLDLDAVLNAVGAERAVLYGISEGGWTSAMYTANHPERVSHLIIYGSYSRGIRFRPGYDAEEIEAYRVLMRKAWGKSTPEVRQIFTTAYFGPNVDPGLAAHFNNLQRASADADTAVRYQDSLHERVDGTDDFRRVHTPTLVIHCRDDQIVAFEEGRRIAALVPGAQFLSLPTGTHYFPTGEEITRRITDAIVRFAR